MWEASPPQLQLRLQVNLHRKATQTKHGISSTTGLVNCATRPVVLLLRCMQNMDSSILRVLQKNPVLYQAQPQTKIHRLYMHRELHHAIADTPFLFMLSDPSVLNRAEHFDADWRNVEHNLHTLTLLAAETTKYINSCPIKISCDTLRSVFFLCQFFLEPFKNHCFLDTKKLQTVRFRDTLEWSFWRRHPSSPLPLPLLVFHTAQLWAAVLPDR